MGVKSISNYKIVVCFRLGKLYKYVNGYAVNLILGSTK